MVLDAGLLHNVFIIMYSVSLDFPEHLPLWDIWFYKWHFHILMIWSCSFCDCLCGGLHLFSCVCMMNSPDQHPRWMIMVAVFFWSIFDLILYVFCWEFLGPCSLEILTYSIYYIYFNYILCMLYTLYIIHVIVYLFTYMMYMCISLF